MTPGPVDRKFATYEQIPGPLAMADLYILGRWVDKAALHVIRTRVDEINAAHESAIAEAVKEAVERCAKMECLIETMGAALAGANRLSMGPSQEAYDHIMVKIAQATREFREWQKGRAQAQGATHG